MTTAPVTSPPPAPPAPEHAAPTAAQEKLSLSNLLLITFLIFAAYGLMIQKIPMPLSLQPWLTLLFLVPVLSIINMAMPGHSKVISTGIGFLWLAVTIITSINLASADLDEALSAPDKIRPRDAKDRLTIDYWLKFSGAINPQMLRARTALYDQLQDGQDIEGRKLDSELQDLNLRLTRNLIQPQDYQIRLNDVAARIQEWEKQGRSIMETITENQKQTTGLFSWSYERWFWIMLALTIVGLFIPGPSWFGSTWFLVAGTLTLVYGFMAAPALADWFSKLDRQNPGGSILRSITTSQNPPQTPALAPLPALPPQQPAVVVAALPSPLQVPEPYQYYKQLEVSANDGKFLLDATVIWQKLGDLKLNAGDVIYWTARGRACAKVPGGFYCDQPDGMPKVEGYSPWAEDSSIEPREFPVGHAYYQALLMKVGGVKFQAGSSGSYTVLQGQQLDVFVMRNIRLPEIPDAKGGGEISVQIARKK